MSVEEDGTVHILTINNPTLSDIGKFTCDIGGVSTSAKLDVEGKRFLAEEKFF